MSRCRWSGCESLERRRLLAAGALDPSFSSDGEATAPGFGVAVTATAAAVQLDGRTVVAGYSADKRFAVARYNVDGSLDATFGPTFNGTVLTAFGHGTFADAVAVQDDGKIVVAGGFADGVDLARYNPDGTLDLAFNSDGRETFNDFGYNDYHAVATALALLPRQSLDTPQRILVGGSLKHGSLITEINYDFFFLRLNGTSGSLDNSFGDDGHRFVGFGDEDRLAAMAVDYTLPATAPSAATCEEPESRGCSAAGDQQLLTVGPCDRPRVDVQEVDRKSRGGRRARTRRPNPNRSSVS
jgi:uncharacterized delta-60 repeat protein